jgi:hypothetical protein
MPIPGLAESGGLAALRTQIAQLTLENGAQPMQAACVMAWHVRGNVVHIYRMPRVMQLDTFMRRSAHLHLPFITTCAHTHGRMPTPMPRCTHGQTGAHLCVLRVPRCEYSEYPSVST